MNFQDRLQKQATISFHNHLDVVAEIWVGRVQIDYAPRSQEVIDYKDQMGISWLTMNLLWGRGFISIQDVQAS